ncbi:MAG: endopeptidase La [Chlamydiae bacterium RIFCSPHIGHO2_12_FULL_44_59]|nr:MAG: endopeptidase La [Chlamydiae bacterium RIFCSPHIGHO2_01_FULL_44_39]OGN58437.1 MAG: endopeptidase La [Chlamydiae bacterium RIFCSPHIGHO2_02_FULL_45_9]OGN59789.1 MAG: endopeptidase La [Chlamydiae bacterium RIFCSPHIGHO2_12_FULL_44_59]OGN65887.1 MAG: endopeptidase La [Chlamydiae bacterium RIFCSPLOWO2_01_FULL_44_52]OGN68297.1 MAG: endopeptidase La [Chlamydiae bacterium RIFCSPLOWO2_02_FULL_45_22]OGN69607.1 MAG: endopeptidase La [Chlamydiae bacterium RIFCSPLOWO2_12_FULL_45_20]
MNEETPPEQDSEREELKHEELIVEDLKKETALVPAYPYPDELYIMPLNRRPFFPGMAAPIVIEPGAYYEVLKTVSKTDHKCFGLFLTYHEDVNIYKIGFEDLYRVGVVARILRIIPMEQGGAQVVLNMEKRVEISKPMKGKYLLAKVQYHDDTPLARLSRQLKAYSISIITTIKELLKLNPLFKEELQIFLGHSDFTEPGRLADFAVALTTATREELQDVLETLDIEKRIDKALMLLKKELDISKLQSTINQRIEATISKTQREFFLREQLKAIKKELGMEKDDKTMEAEKFEERIKARKVPESVLKVIREEMEKLSALEVQSAEYGVVRNYIDWLTIIPWGIFTKETHDLKKAESVLEEDHYGLKDIKERILEFIGVGKLTGGVKGSIICLVGPPGVGKTSIGKSVARALNRKFYRFSVGGMRDEAEIKGHRRTYIGAMPGKMIQALKYSQTMNPVIMLDEVDKMGASYHGDPASALLEVLDPEQNKDFLDHYLDVHCDLSNVLFIVTSNVLDTIPEPLKDRMEILRLSGYIAKEKVEIAKKYLIPRNRKNMGLKTSDIAFSKGAIAQIINGYAREAGVRSLENNIKKIMRKVAVKIARGKTPKASITEKNLTDYLGKPIFTEDRYYQKTPVGVATGLAWTALGGATLYVEATRYPSEKTEMKLTGQAGDVMKESAQIAWSYAQSNVKRYAKDIPFFEKSQIHLHIPEGATPKDGPSAGITMTTALLSLLLNKPILDNLGMTGELTLTGRILPIGGLKEKLIAARRSKLNVLIFPKENLRDYDELPDFLKKGLTVHFVEHFDEVFQIAFPKLKVHHEVVRKKTRQPRENR